MADANQPTPLTAIQKLAFWSVPATGAVAIACCGTLLWMAFSTPQTKSSANVSDETPRTSETTTAAVAANKPPVTPDERPEKKQTEPAKKKREKTAGPKTPAVVKNQPADHQSAAIASAIPAPVRSIDFAAAGLPDPVFWLTCEDNAIRFDGPKPIKFESQSPVVTQKQIDSEVMQCIAFNGINQSINLPDLPKSSGSISVTALVTNFKNCIFLDSDSQNLTLRKNRMGLRWRVISKKWSSKIRETQPKFDPEKWHHIVITWQDGSDAVLYVDGVEFDRYSYLNKSSDPPSFSGVVLGQTRGKGYLGNKFYESWIGDVHFFDQPLDENNVKSLNGAIRQQHPSFFNH